MAVSTTSVIVSYTPNGSTSTFAVPFQFLAAGDLVVTYVDSTGVKTTKVLGVDYTVNGGGFNSTGGNVVFGTAPASGKSLTIQRVTGITQSTSYVANDSFPASTTEAALDRLTLISQEVNYGLTLLNANSVTYVSLNFSTWVSNGSTPNGLVFGKISL